MALGNKLTGTVTQWRWVWVPLAVFTVTRVIDGLFLVICARRQTLFGESPGVASRRPPNGSSRYWAVVCNWDGQWYRSIAESGYPLHLPVVAGRVAQNEWAFYPAYPGLVRLVMTCTGWGFPLAASVTSLACSACAVTLLYRLMQRRAGTFVATGTVVGLCTFAAAPAFQVAYTESLALLLLVLALWTLQSRRYTSFALVAVCLALTRAIVLPLATVVAVHWWVRWRGSRHDPFPTIQRIGVGALALFTAALAGLWPATAALVTRVPNAFFVTQAAWVEQGAWSAWPSWFSLARHGTPPAITLLVVAAVVLVVFVALRRPAANWGHGLRAWVLLYPLYLVMSTRATTSIVRYLMLGIASGWPFPDTAGDAGPDPGPRWAALVLVAGFGLTCQYFWVSKLFIPHGFVGLAP